MPADRGTFFNKVAALTTQVKKLRQNEFSPLGWNWWDLWYSWITFGIWRLHDWSLLLVKQVKKNEENANCSERRDLMTRGPEKKFQAILSWNTPEILVLQRSQSQQAGPSWYQKWEGMMQISAMVPQDRLQAFVICPISLFLNFLLHKTSFGCPGV